MVSFTDSVVENTPLQLTVNCRHKKYNVLMCKQIERFIVFNLKFKIVWHKTELDIAVGMAIRQRAGRFGVQISAWSRDLFCKTSRRTTRSTQPPNRWVPGILPGVRRSRKVLTTHLHPAPSLKMSKAALLLLLYAFMVKTGDNFLFNRIIYAAEYFILNFQPANLLS